MIAGFRSNRFLVYSQRSMNALNDLRDWIRDHQKVLTSFLAVGGLLLVFIGTQKQVTLIANDQIELLSTHARTIGALLAETGFTPVPGDEIFPPLNHQLKDKQVIVFNSSRSLILDEDGDVKRARTTQQLPENILMQTGYRLYPGDSIRSFGNFSSEPEMGSVGRDLWLRIDRGHPIQLEIDGDLLQFSSSAATLGEALWEAGIAIYDGDFLEPGANTPLTSAIKVRVERSSSYTIIADGRQVNRRATGETVAEILASAGINLTGLDYTIPSLDAPPPSGNSIRVVRVVEEMLVELEPVEFETVYRPADQLELDTLEVLEPGTFGVQSNTIRIRYEDGEEIARSIEQAVTAVEPKQRVIGYGTQIVVRTLATAQGTLEYWRSIPIYATSYSPCNLGVPWCGTRTASGKEVKRGITGVIRSWYNLMRGWGIFVPGYGPGTFEDIGAGIAGRDWIDLGFTDENFEPWHQWTTLYFLTPVPPLESIPWILP
jgi:uncharacterized protein YabE (DUF348 family)